MKRHLGTIGVRAFWYLAMCFLYVPLLVVVIYSFNRANSPVVFTGASLRWYRQLFDDPVIMSAYENSAILAIVSSTVSTVIGTLLGYGIFAHRDHKLSWLTWLVYYPIVVPDVVYGISQMVFFSKVSQTTGLLTPGMSTMIISHISFQVPFVALVVYSRMAGMDQHLFDACRDLYANGLQRAFYFILPMLRPAVLGGFFLAFTLSIDDLVISFFTAGPQSTTLPIYIWSTALRKGVSPEINAAAGVLIGVVFLIAVAIGFGVLANGWHKDARRMTEVTV